MDFNYDEYISKLSQDITKLAKLRYLLIYEKDNVLKYSEGTDLDIIADEYETEKLNPEEALNIILAKLSCDNGALYELKNQKYELVVRSKKNGK